MKLGKTDVSSGYTPSSLSYYEEISNQSITFTWNVDISSTYNITRIGKICTFTLLSDIQFGTTSSRDTIISSVIPTRFVPTTPIYFATFVKETTSGNTPPDQIWRGLLNTDGKFYIFRPSLSTTVAVKLYNFSFSWTL